tara:strand:- start:66 stop:1178 length:1113 start_codon:yes stop_codon:yes gene_type:complete
MVKPHLKRILFTFGVIGFTIGIIWSLQPKNHTAGPEVSFEAENTLENPNKPFWSQFMPKTTLEKSDVSRSSRQLELAQMINGLRGVEQSTVVLSDHKKTGIGVPHRLMTACVSIVPEDDFLPAPTVRAIRKLVSGATNGLLPEQVVVINNETGMECSESNNFVLTKRNPAKLKKKIDDALGISASTLAVTFARPSKKDLQIPMKDSVRPEICLTLPSHWVASRSQQVGSEAILLQSLRSTIQSIAADAVTKIDIITTKAPSGFQQETNQSYAKQIMLFVGVFLIFASNMILDRRRRPQEAIIIRRLENPSIEAGAILQMDFTQAKCAIDLLEGQHKYNVLDAIVSMGDDSKEVPVIEVQKQKKLTFTKCG